METAGVSTFSSLIREFGPNVVLLAVFIVLFIFTYKLFLKQSSSMMETMKKQNEQMFNSLIQPKEEPQLLDAHIVVNEMVGQQLRHLRDVVDADRTFIYMFHNTDHGIGGFPFLKASCYYEWSISTVRALLGKQKDIPVFLLATALKSLGEGKPFVVNDILAGKTQYPELYSYMKEVDSRATVLVPLRGRRGGTVGFLGIDFVTEPILEEDEETIVREVTSAALVIEGILNATGGIVNE